MKEQIKNLAVLFGGRSVEHEISVITALQLINVLDVERYRPIPVYIAQSGRWYTGDALLNKELYKKLPASLSQVQEVTLLPVPRIGGLTVLQPKKHGEVIPVDIYFLAFHGTYGEDGCIQGLMEMADVAYTGCGVLSAALGMNKYQCKTHLAAHGIPVLPATVVHRDEGRKSLTAVRERILSTPGLEQFPLFVKPCNLGSSIGISVASDIAGLNAALVNTFRYDAQAIVEPCVKDILEINVAVLEDEEPVASVVEMPVSTSGVLTYEDKYLRGEGNKQAGESQGMASLTRVIDPKDLNVELKQAAIEYALKAFKVLGCSGVARIDFIIDSTTDKIYFNEINTLPGSLSFYLWVKSEPPLLYTELLNRIIERAEMRQRTKVALRRNEGLRALFK
ncbi:D-alanine--D-alanine ligase family protein [Microseira wollei]|uniref:D-alanine--D-alanine ligase n=1 Tax=Microseira wollei NIES-4236 TaxID=2530354 RepID=A0AAV3WH31_9CYAN|nr:D-alanine--D-alanine ligase family protein [Microseira wollei]GET38004.1 D-alanine-D-alanine ligase A [Microseira wollei NIES-4236]